VRVINTKVGGGLEEITARLEPVATRSAKSETGQDGFNAPEEFTSFGGQHLPW
jgi:hypothetical protein